MTVHVKTLVVYYSRTGNTKRIGDEIAAALKADVEELQDGKSRSGPFGFLMAGREAMKKTPVELQPLAHDPAAYDMVVVGSPIWANGICSPVRTFLAQHRTSLKKVAWFCTSGSVQPGYASNGFDAMTEESGQTPAATLGLGRQEIKGDHSRKVSAFTASVSSHR